MNLQIHEPLVQEILKIWLDTSSEEKKSRKQ